MSDDLERLLRRIKVRVRLDDPTATVELLRLTEQYPLEPSAWDALAYAYAQEKHFPEAIAAMTRVLELAPLRPDGYFTRGRYALEATHYENAIADLMKGLALCDELNIARDTQAILFRLAEANYQIGRKAEALTNLRCVKEGTIIWTVKGRSKDELLALCADAVTPDNDGRYQGPIDSEEMEMQKDWDQWQLPEEPDIEEATLTEILGSEALAKADATLMKSIRPRWQKAAMVLGIAMDADHRRATDELVCVYLRRLIALVEAGALEGAGNLRRPRFSEVALPNNADEIEQDEQEGQTDP